MAEYIRAAMPTSNTYYAKPMPIDTDPTWADDVVALTESVTVTSLYESASIAEPADQYAIFRRVSETAADTDPVVAATDTRQSTTLRIVATLPTANYYAKPLPLAAGDWADDAIAIPATDVPNLYQSAEIPDHADQYAIFRRVGETAADTDPFLCAVDATISTAVDPTLADLADDITDILAAVAGPGDLSKTLEILDDDGLPVAHCAVSLTTTPAYNHPPFAGPRYTDAHGTVRLFVDPGTYYVWRQHPTVRFTQPNEEVIPGTNQVTISA